MAGPTQVGWASATLGGLIAEPKGTDRSRHGLCTSERLGRLEALRSPL